MASSTTRRHSLDDPREDVGQEVRFGVGAVECQLNNAVSRRIEDGKRQQARQLIVER